MEAGQTKALLRDANRSVGAKQRESLFKIQNSDGVRLWFFGEWAYLGSNWNEAARTAKEGDWWVESRDGELGEREKSLFTMDGRDDRAYTILHNWRHQANLLKTQRQLYPSRHTSKLRDAARREMDPGERLTLEDFEAVKLSSDLETPKSEVIHLYTLDNSAPWYDFRSWFKRRIDRGVYVFDDFLREWKSVIVSIRPDGYSLQYGTPFKGNYCSTLCGEVILDDETKTLLNFKLFDDRRRPILRLVGNGKEGVSFHEFNIHS